MGLLVSALPDRNYTAHVSLLRDAIKQGRTNTVAGVNVPYDNLAPPISTRNDSYVTLDGTVQYPKGGTTIGVHVRVFKVESVNIKASRMRVKVWFRLQWVDERLSWTPAEYGGVTSLHFRANGVHLAGSDIWLPDVRPYNVDQGIESSLEPALAFVASDGQVYWSRPGTLDILCRFTGINRFPYDREVHCPVNVGGWILGSHLQGIQTVDGGIDQRQASNLPEASANNTYTEWKMLSANATVESRIYPCCVDEPYPVILYHLVLSRQADLFYLSVFIMPSLVAAIGSVLVFFLHPAAGERLGYCITLNLAMQFGKVVAMETVPVCPETLWSDVFVIYNELVTLFALIETCVVLALHFNDGSRGYSVPRWLKCLVRKHAAKLPRSLAWVVPVTEEVAQEHAVSANVALLKDMRAEVRLLGSAGSPAKKSPQRLAATLSMQGLVRAKHAAAKPNVEGGAPRAMPEGDAEPGVVQRHATVRRGNAAYDAAITALAAQAGVGRLGVQDMKKLTAFERLYFTLEEVSDGDGWVSAREVESFLSFVAFDLDFATRRRIIIDCQTDADELQDATACAPPKLSRTAAFNKDVQLRQLFSATIDRVEFLRICITALWERDSEVIESAAQTFGVARHLVARRSAAYWRGVAAAIDRFCGGVIFPLYLLSLPVVYSLQTGFIDRRFSDPSAFQGFDYGAWISTAHYIGTVVILIVSGVLVHVVMAYRQRVRDEEVEVSTYTSWRQTKSGSFSKAPTQVPANPPGHADDPLRA